MTPSAGWPPLTLVRVDVAQSARYSGMRELTPLFSRPVHAQWFHVFRENARNAKSATFEWLGANFARCDTELVPRVVELLHEITDATNLDFELFLLRAGDKTPEKVADLIAIESIAHASEKPGDEYMLPPH